MTSVTDGARRRTTAGILASTLVLSGAAIAAPTGAMGDTRFDLVRLAGDDRYATAAEIARSTFTSSDEVILASGATGNYPDALTGNYLAGVHAAPVLLTAPKTLPRATREALGALRARRVFIVGGTSAVSASVEAELRRAGYDVERTGGNDRYATAAAVVQRSATATADVGSLNGARTAILASGEGFADILAAAPLSYSDQLPLMITRRGALPESTRDLLRDLRIARVVIVGGTAAVSTAVEADVRALDGVVTVTRVSGSDRFGTAVAVADFALANLGYTATHVDLARSDDFADALAGGPHSGREKAPMLLTGPTTLSDVTRSWLASHSATLADGHVFGGVAAVSADVQRAAVAAGRFFDITVTVTSSTVVAGGTITGTIDGDVSVATASGCGVADVAIDGDRDASAAGRQFTLSVPADLATGPCTLTITIVLTEGGAPIARTIPLSVIAAPAPPTAAPPPTTTPPDTTAPSLKAQGTAPAAGATTVAFDADEPLLASSATRGDVAITGGTSQATVESVTVSGATITVTTSPLVDGNVVTLEALSVSDLAGNLGPAADVATAATTPAGPTGSALVARWHMEDTGGTMQDATGRGHDGTLTDVLVQRPGFAGFGYEFEALPSYVTVPDSLDLDPADGAFSITVRVRFSGLPAGGPVDGLDQNTYDVVRKGLSTTSGGNWKLEITSSGAAYCLFRGSAGQRGVSSTTTLDDGAWHTVTCSRTATGVSLGVDGSTWSAAAVTGTIDNDEPLVFGSKNSRGEDQYVGLLDEAEIRKG